jgi:hypothetical protein
MAENAKISDRSALAGCGCLSVVIIVVACWMASCLGASSRRAHSNPQPEPAIKAIVIHDAGGVDVTNNDTFPWENVKIMINAQGFGDGYYRAVSNLDSGKSIRTQYGDFAMDDGKRFDIKTSKVNTVTVSALTPMGYAVSTFTPKE